MNDRALSMAEREDVYDLLEQWCERELSDDGRARLERMALESQEARALYVEYALLQASLPRLTGRRGVSAFYGNALPVEVAATFSSHATTPVEESSAASHCAPMPGDVWRRRWRPWPLSLAAGVVAVLILISMMAWLRLPGFRAAPGPQDIELTHKEALAHVVNLVGADWSGSDRWVKGSALGKGQAVELRSGLAEIRFQSGARVVLEGPARFVVNTANEGVLKNGRMTAQVPLEARGFRVDLPTFSVIDLGTEFGVVCDENRRAEVHVFSGEVEIVPGENGNAPETPPIPRQKLSAGQGVVIQGAEGAVESQAADRSRFVPPQHPLLRGVKLLAFYPFEGNANDASGNERHATRVENVEFVGEAGAKAARFHGNGKSYVRLPIDASPSGLPRMTWGAWVRPRQLRLETNHMILSTDNDDYDRVLALDSRFEATNRPGPRHRFAAFAGDERGVVADEDREIELGRWTFIAASYDQSRRTLSLYVEHPQPGEQGRKLRETTYRNTNFNDGRNDIYVGDNGPPWHESFMGDIDNVFTFKGILTHDELEQIAAGGEKAFQPFISQVKGDTDRKSER